jgi:hypothetical protein
MRGQIIDAGAGAALRSIKAAWAGLPLARRRAA